MYRNRLHLHLLARKRETSIQFFFQSTYRQKLGSPCWIFPSHKALICALAVMTLCHPVCFCLTRVSEVVRYTQAGSSASFHTHPKTWLWPSLWPILQGRPNEIDNKIIACECSRFHCTVRVFNQRFISPL